MQTELSVLAIYGGQHWLLLRVLYTKFRHALLQSAPSAHIRIVGMSKKRWYATVQHRWHI